MLQLWLHHKRAGLDAKRNDVHSLLRLLEVIALTLSLIEHD